MNTLKMNFISAMRIMAVIAMIGNVAAWTRMTGGKAAFIKSELTTKKTSNIVVIIASSQIQ